MGTKGCTAKPRNGRTISTVMNGNEVLRWRGETNIIEAKRLKLLYEFQRRQVAEERLRRRTQTTIPNQGIGIPLINRNKNSKGDGPPYFEGPRSE